jgi:hypothetical protein
MRHWRVFLIAIGFAAAGFAAGAHNGIELKGELSASETEMEEGYFSIEADTTLVVRPGSPMHQWLRDHAGRQVRLLVEPVQTTNE